VMETEDVLNGVAEVVEGFRAGIAFVAAHDGGPLVGGHGSGAGVGKQVDEDVVRGEKEEVVEGGAEEVDTLGAGGPTDRLNGLDAEGLDDRSYGHVGSLGQGSRGAL
jgi:hypothetical protein